MCLLMFFNEAMYSIISLQTSVNRYVSSCNAYGVKVALYGCLSQPSSSLDVLVKVSYVLGCIP